MFFTSDPKISFLVIFILILFGMALAYTAYHGIKKQKKKWWVLFLLRISIYVGIILLLTNINLSWTATVSKTPLIRAFFDNSVSVLYNQHVSTESLNGGYNDIKEQLEEISGESQKDIRIELYSIGAELDRIAEDSEVDLNFSQPATHLSSIFQDVSSIPSDQYLAGVVLVSDGQYTVGGDPLQMVESLDVPVYSVGIGQTSPMIDVRVDRIEVPTVGVKGETEIAEVFVSSIGNINERVNVTLTKGKKLLGSKVISLSGKNSINIVKFYFQMDEIGTQDYSVHVSTIKDEINIDNNRSVFSISVLKDKFRVALITGVPTPNTSFLKQILRKNKRFQVDHYVHLPTGWQTPIAQFWRYNYDLIVLDNFPTSNSSSRWADDLKTKLKRKSSALAVVTGPNVDHKKMSSFYSLLGVRNLRESGETDISLPIEFSNEANSHPIFSISDPELNINTTKFSLPPIRPFLLLEPVASKLASLILLYGDAEIPLFIAGEVPVASSKSQIRIVIYSSSELWLLHFKIMNTNYSSFVEEWWQRSINWLVKSDSENDMYFRLNKTVYQQGESIQVVGTVMDMNRVELNEGEVVLTVLKNGEEAGLYPLAYSDASNYWEGNYFASKPGSYKFLVEAYQSGVLKGQYNGSFRVEESQIELNNVFLNKRLLSSIAEKTGGKYIDWENRNSIKDEILIQPRSVVVNHSIQFTKWAPLGLILLILLVIEWIFRRYINLL